MEIVIGLLIQVFSTLVSAGFLALINKLLSSKKKK